MNGPKLLPPFASTLQQVQGNSGDTILVSMRVRLLSRSAFGRYPLGGDAPARHDIAPRLLVVPTCVGFGDVAWRQGDGPGMTSPLQDRHMALLGGTELVIAL